MHDRFTPLPGQTHRAALTYQFEHQPARTLHPQWAKRLLDLPGEGWRSRSAEPRISAYLIEQMGLTRPYAEPEQGDGRAFLILPPSVLIQLIQLTGAVLLAPLLRRVIDGTILRDLSQVIGERFLPIVRSKAPFLYRQGSLGDYQREDGETWLQAIERAGVEQLVAGTREEGRGAHARLKLKLQPRYEPCFSKTPSTTGHESLLLMKKLLLKEVDPRWAPIF